MHFSGNFKKLLLTLYNIFMFLGYFYVFCLLCLKYNKHGTNFFPKTYAHVFPIISVVQAAQFLEVIYPLLGYINGGFVMPFLQIWGRAFILFISLSLEPKLQKEPVIFYLFFAWSGIEVIRYPYYISQIYKKDNYFLTWLRYSAWMLFYPFGFTCEVIIVMRNLMYIQQKDSWFAIFSSVLNLSFDFVTFLKCYVLFSAFVMFPGFFSLLHHMNKARVQKLGNLNSKFIQKVH